MFEEPPEIGRLASRSIPAGENIHSGANKFACSGVNCELRENRPISGGSFLVTRAPTKLYPGLRRIIGAGRCDRARRAGRAVGDCIMSGQTYTRRAVIAAWGAVALVAAIGGDAALAQSGQAVRNTGSMSRPCAPTPATRPRPGSSKSCRGGSLTPWPGV